MESVGHLTWISGPVVRARMTGKVQMLEQMHVGQEHLVGELIAMHQNTAVVQVYEDTSGVKPGDPIYGTGMPLSVELGPGLMGGIFDGIQRPLETLAQESGPFIRRGVTAAALSTSAGSSPISRAMAWISCKVSPSAGSATPGWRSWSSNALRRMSANSFSV